MKLLRLSCKCPKIAKLNTPNPIVTYRDDQKWQEQWSFVEEDANQQKKQQ